MNGAIDGNQRILVVDDDATLRHALRIILMKENYNVTEAEDGKVAQELMEKADFDLVISDIKMPRLDGVALFEWNKKTKNIPTILITGFSDLLETQEAFNLGVKEFLAKPFDAKEILKAIHCLLSE